MTTHLSTRLVWHDRTWDGHICDHPSKNAYCIVQQHIRDGRDDEREDKAAGLPLAELDGWQPPCSRDPIAFSLAEDSKQNDPVLAERWQILSPVRNHEFGTTEINRKIQSKYRGGMLNYSKGKSVKPFGEQEIVWTDRVMQAINYRKTSYPKGEGLSYVANGEIGLVVSTSKGKDRADSMKVQFSTQPLSSYNGCLDLVITSEDGLDGSINAAEIERIARTKILLED